PYPLSRCGRRGETTHSCSPRPSQWRGALWAAVGGEGTLRRFGLDWLAGVAPGVEAAFEMGDVGVAHLLEHVGRQRRAATPGAIEDDAAVGVEFGPVVTAGRVRPEFEHAPRRGHGSRNDAEPRPLVRLADVDEERIPL